ncbi:hypothetical protein ACQJBY_009061 [Aegilops geniculata]
MSIDPAVVCFLSWNHETKPESPTSQGSSSPSSFGRRHSSPTPAPSILPEPTFAPLRDPDPETAVDAPVIDYVDDDPSSLSAELPGWLQKESEQQPCWKRQLHRQHQHTRHPLSAIPKLKLTGKWPCRHHRPGACLRWARWVRWGRWDRWGRCLRWGRWVRRRQPTCLGWGRCQ